MKCFGLWWAIIILIIITAMAGQHKCGEPCTSAFPNTSSLAQHRIHCMHWKIHLKSQANRFRQRGLSSSGDHDGRTVAPLAKKGESVVFEFGPRFWKRHCHRIVDRPFSCQGKIDWHCRPGWGCLGAFNSTNQSLPKLSKDLILFSVPKLRQNQASRYPSRRSAQRRDLQRVCVLSYFVRT